MRLAIIILFLIKTLEIQAQSPKFSFTQESVKITTEDINTKILVFKGSYTSKNQLQGKKAILGNSHYNRPLLIFTPLISFQVNTKYTIVFKNTFFEFSIPLEASYQRLQIKELYPNTTTLPTNFLKWYVAFSKPVNSTNIYNHISLINNKTNTKVDRALLPLENPLLSNDGKLLTLWIEPGRQKRDLGPNKRLGEVLVKGESYTLVIDKNLKDVDGITMKSDFKHPFTIVQSDRVQPNINTWELSLPKSSTKKPLIINFNDVLDYGSLNSKLFIMNRENKIIQGTFIIDANNKRAIFNPSTSWKKDSYILKCNKTIEDISGNNLERPFDRDIQKEIVAPILELKFSILN